MNASLHRTAPPVISPDMLRRLDVAGPRCTSHPTADRFAETFGPDGYRRALRFVRSIAMVFDRHLRADQASAQFSRVV